MVMARAAKKNNNHIFIFATDTYDRKNINHSKKELLLVGNSFGNSLRSKNINYIHYSTGTSSLGFSQL